LGEDIFFEVRNTNGSIADLRNGVTRSRASARRLGNRAEDLLIWHKLGTRQGRAEGQYAAEGEKRIPFGNDRQEKQRQRQKERQRQKQILRYAQDDNFNFSSEVYISKSMWAALMTSGSGAEAR